MKKNKTDPQGDFESDEGADSRVDDIYKHQKRYFKTGKGKSALKRARKKYDKKDLERRRKQKREYMRRRRARDPDAWRY